VRAEQLRPRRLQPPATAMACVLSPCVEVGTQSASSSAPQPSPCQPSPLQLRCVGDNTRGTDDTMTASARDQAQRAAAKVAAEAARQRGRGFDEDDMSRAMSPTYNKEPSSPTSDEVYCDNCFCAFLSSLWVPAVRAWIVRMVGFFAITNFCVAVSLDHPELLAAALSAAVAWMALYNHAVQKDCRSLLLPHEARGIDARAVVLKGMAAAGPGVGSGNYIGGIADSGAAVDSDLVAHARAMGVDLRGAGMSDETLQTVLISSMANEYLRNVATLRQYQAKYGRLAGVPDRDDFTVRHLLGELGFAAAALAEGGGLLRSPAPAGAGRGGHMDEQHGGGTKSSTFGSWPQLADDLDRLELDVTASSFNSMAGERGRGAGSTASHPTLLASHASPVQDLSKSVDDPKRSIDVSRKSSKLPTPVAPPVAPPAPSGAAASSSAGALPSPAYVPSPMPSRSIEDSSKLPLWLRQIRS